jgi:hypothetical protein
MNPTPVGHYLRFLRDLEPGAHKNEAAPLLDALNAEGVSDRDLLSASTLLIGHLLNLQAAGTGMSVDQLTEQLIREWAEQNP